MSDYTPTTEEVRWQFSTDSPSEFMPEQFDRWLFQVTEDAFDKGYEAGLNDALSAANGEGSGNSSSQPTAETPNYLNLEGEEQ